MRIHNRFQLFWNGGIVGWHYIYHRSHSIIVMLYAYYLVCKHKKYLFNLVPNKLNLGYMNLYWPYSPFKFISFGITIVKSVIRPKLKRVVVSEPTKLYTHSLFLMPKMSLSKTPQVHCDQLGNAQQTATRRFPQPRNVSVVRSTYINLFSAYNKKPVQYCLFF